MKADLDAEGDLVHNPSLFDCHSWLRITNVIGWADYRPLVTELEEPPRDNRPDRPTGVTVPVIVAVTVSKKGRTGKRGPVLVYSSQSQATQAHGRRVRSSIEAGKAVDGVRARKIERT